MRKFLFLLSIIILLSACKSQTRIAEEGPEPDPEPAIEVLEPLFEIVSIVILQNDLINTQFETVIKVNNPNEFSLFLSSLEYKLYGNGLFWAEGRVNDIVTIPAKNSSETKFNSSMNFIGTNRRLLDDIIALRQVRYRFTGKAEVQPDIPRLPPFIMNFDCTGLSDVKEKAK